MRVVVGGAVAWGNADAIGRELSQLRAGTVIVHGDCRGADDLAGQIGRELGFAVSGG